MTKLYKRTTQPTNTPQTPKKGQNDTRTQVTFVDVMQSIITFVLLAGVLLLITAFAPKKAHSFNHIDSRLTSYPASQNKNNLLLGDSMGQNVVLSNQKSGKPNRYSLAFFVFNNSLLSQSNALKDTTHLTQFTGVNRHFNAHSVTSYGGVTLQNKRKPICRAVANKTESEPRHPIFNSVVLTHNLLGGHTHA